MALFFILWISGLDRFHLNVFLAIVVIVIGTAVAAYAEGALHVGRYRAHYRR